MALKLEISFPAEALFAHAEDSFISDPWESVGLSIKNSLYDAIIDRIPKSSPLKILDIGCGAGGLALRLAQGNQMPNFTYVGIDLSPKAIQIAKGHNLNASKFSFEVQNVYEYVSQVPCDWDILISSMFLYGFDASTLFHVREGVLRYSKKGYIIAAGIQEKRAIESITGDTATVVSGQTNSDNMVVASKILNVPKAKIPTFRMPSRSSIVENGEYNYALAVIQQKKTGTFPNTVQGVTGMKLLNKTGGKIITGVNSMSVPMKPSK